MYCLNILCTVHDGTVISAVWTGYLFLGFVVGAPKARSQGGTRHLLLLSLLCYGIGTSH